jgi:hypothetical protein
VARRGGGAFWPAPLTCLSLAPNAPLDLLRRAQDVARSVSVPEQPQVVRQTIEKLQKTETRRKGQRSELRQGSAPDSGYNGGNSMGSANGRISTPAESAGAVAVQPGVGELEVAASADANTVVVAGNGGPSFSSNGGATFGAGTTGVFGLSDPSIARAASGNFYLDVIAFPNGTPAQLNVNAMDRSVSNGSNFALQGCSAQCPQCPPPARVYASRARSTSPRMPVNSTAGGNDQLYAVWCNFTPAAPVASCMGSGVALWPPQSRVLKTTV